MANIRTFRDLQTEVLAWLDEAGDTDVTQALVKQSIRAAHEKRLLEERWSFMLSKVKTLTTVVGQQTYTLDPEFLRLMYLKNLTTADPMIEFQDENVLNSGYDWSIDQDTAHHYMLTGHSEVANQPTSASAITVTSSNIADTAVTVTVRGDTAAGTQSETIIVGATGSVLFTEIFKVTKSSGWVGTMTLKTNAGAVTNLILAASEYGKSYQQIYLLAIPNVAESLEYRFYKQPSPLVADNDRPDYPSPFEELLVWEALCDLATYNSYAQPMVNYWAQKKAELLTAMGVTTNQAQSINQAAVYTTYIPR